MDAPIRYRIIPKNPQAHLFEVTCTVENPDPQGQRFSLPVWIPGSYLIREFARHVVSIRASSGRRPVALDQLDKHTWQAAPVRDALSVVAQIYAWDLSVRGAHLDATHGFFNGTSVFLCALGYEQRPCEVEILAPAGARYRDWRVATSMPRKGARPWSFGRYGAADYDELIDHPVELGTFDQASFRACGVTHDIAISGRHDADLPRLCRDLKRVCEHHIRFFGEPAPMKRYLFLVTALSAGYGGLEHRASTALLCSRADLPRRGTERIDDNYRNFLGLCSHEYFHTWNVKRIKPAAFSPYDLARENYTTLLWAFEGITSYYDDLALVRCGLITPETYLETLGRIITTLLRGAGRKRQSLAEASFDAWTKYYRQDENAPNALVSYYLKGSLVALCLDLLIRGRTRGRKSLDDVMRALWQRYGRSRTGVEEDAVERLAQEVTGLRLRAFFDHAVRSTEELPLRTLLATHGIRLQLRAAESASDRGGAPPSSLLPQAHLGLGVRSDGDSSELRLTHVLDDGPAQQAGLAAGDLLIALDGLRVTPKNLQTLLARYRAGERIEAHAFRRDELFRCEIRLQEPAIDTCYLRLVERSGTRSRRQRWFKGDQS